MKKILLLALAATTLLASCSKDDDKKDVNIPPIDEEDVNRLPIKAIFKNLKDPNETSETTFKYEGKLLKEKSSGQMIITTYNYKDGLLTEVYEKDSNGELSFKENYIYENGKVIKSITLEPYTENDVRKEGKIVSTYSYDNKGRLASITNEESGNIKTIDYQSDNLIVVRNSSSKDYDKYIYSNENLIKEEQHIFNENGKDIIDFYAEYSYDNKKSFSKIIQPSANPKDIFTSKGSKNNKTKTQQYFIRRPGMIGEGTYHKNPDFNESYQWDSNDRLVKHIQESEYGKYETTYIYE